MGFDYDDAGAGSPPRAWGQRRQCRGRGRRVRFPLYRSIIPQSQSRFLIERQLLITTLKEVMLAAGGDAPGVEWALRPRSVELSASAPEVGTTSAKLPAKFVGGGDSVIHTSFNPGFVLDALQSLSGEGVVLDVAQNVYAADGQVAGRPMLLSSDGDARIRWVLMPLHMNYPATREYLGSNYREAEVAAAS